MDFYFPMAKPCRMEYDEGSSNMNEMRNLMNILFEDKDILVVEKPAGVPVETRRIGQADMVSLLKNHLAQKQPGKPPYLGMIHRLDQPVQGVMVFAKTPAAAKDLSSQLSNGSMQKIYRAVVNGALPKSGELTDYLLKDGRTNTSRIVPKGTKDAKLSKLTYQCLGHLSAEELSPDVSSPAGLSLAEIHLLTGRHHQIRVQMSGAGFPLYGDQKYNPTSPHKHGEHVALCAFQLTFRHPATKKALTFSCMPAGEIFKKFSI